MEISSHVFWESRSILPYKTEAAGSSGSQ